MKLKQTREQSRQFHLHSRELLNQPEQEHLLLPKLEGLLTSGRRRIIDQHLAVIIHEYADKKTADWQANLSIEMWGMAILDQVLIHRVVSPPLRNLAVRQLLAPHSIRSFKQEVLEYRSTAADIWAPLIQMTALVQLDPSLRERFEIDDETFTHLIKKFLRWQDGLPVADKPWVLASLAMIRPDKKNECEAMLRQIGDDGKNSDYGQFIWDMRKQKLREDNVAWVKGLVGVRLLEAERELDEEDKDVLLEKMKARLLGSRPFHTNLQQIANAALLLASQVEIGPDGKVLILGSHSKLGAGPELPQRPMI